MTNTVASWVRPSKGGVGWVRRVCLAAVVMLAVFLLVRLVLAVIAPTSLWEPVLVAGPSQTSITSDGPYDFSYNPFEVGDDDGPVAPEPAPGTDAPETTLNLVLVGLRSGENGTAFIRTPDNQDKNYYVDDEVMPGVILQGVFPGYVLIRVNGQTQRLTMEEPRLQGQRNASGVERGSLQTLRTIDAATLLSQARFSVAEDESGARVGVTIEPRTPALDLSAYGLERGDVITRFAGQSLSSGLPDISALRRIASSGRPVDVDIIRDGKPMTLTIGN